VRLAAWSSHSHKQAVATFSMAKPEIEFVSLNARRALKTECPAAISANRRLSRVHVQPARAFNLFIIPPIIAKRTHQRALLIAVADYTRQQLTEMANWESRTGANVEMMRSWLRYAV